MNYQNGIHTLYPMIFLIKNFEIEYNIEHKIEHKIVYVNSELLIFCVQSKILVNKTF